MRSIIKFLLLGLVISAAFLGAVYVWALVGYPLALELLLKLILPSFNLAALVLGPTAPDDLDGGPKMLYVFFLSAWLQIGVVCALALAGLRAVLARQK